MFESGGGFGVLDFGLCEFWNSYFLRLIVLKGGGAGFEMGLKVCTVHGCRINRGWPLRVSVDTPA